MIYVLYLIHILISIFLILVVLLQQGKGADLSVFGGGGTQVAFGARGAATVLHKLTVICFVLFLVTTLTLGILSARSAPSVMAGVDAGEEVEEPASDLGGPAGGTLEGGDEDGTEGTQDADDPPSAGAEGEGEGEGEDPPASDSGADDDGGAADDSSAEGV